MQLVEAEGAQAGHRQLDRERQSVEPFADGLDGVALARHVYADERRSLVEQGDRVV